MRKTFLVLVAITTAVGSIAATAASAQRGATPVAPDRHRPASNGAGPRSLRRFWQLRMGDTALLRRP
jgi:hypothetical protein